jgi:hypothetical protein
MWNKRGGYETMLAIIVIVLLITFGLFALFVKIKNAVGRTPDDACRAGVELISGKSYAAQYTAEDAIEVLLDRCHTNELAELKKTDVVTPIAAQLHSCWYRFAEGKTPWFFLLGGKTKYCFVCSVFKLPPTVKLTSKSAETSGGIPVAEFQRALKEFMGTKYARNKQDWWSYASAGFLHGTPFISSINADGKPFVLNALEPGNRYAVVAYAPVASRFIQVLEGIGSGGYVESPTFLLVMPTDNIPRSCDDVINNPP